jgi:hypothetical protein
MSKFMSKSIAAVLVMGGSLHTNTEEIAVFDCTRAEADIIISHRILDSIYDRTYGEYIFADGSILHLWDAGPYAKKPWYFMAYSCTESDAIRERRANPTPDTSHE